jgi:hypothetical protein
LGCHPSLNNPVSSPASKPLRRLCADLRQRLAAGQTTQALLAGALVENVV